MRLLIPDVELIESFSKNTRPLFEQIRTIQQESRRLAELRDTLLPRLMSGELKVNDLENNEI
jgi:type I restriction enzyme S subunit